MTERELFFGTLSLLDIFDTILTSFPEGFLIFCIGVALFNMPLRAWWDRAVIAGVVYSVGMHTVYYYEFRVDYKFFALYVLLVFLVKGLVKRDWMSTIGMVSAAYSFSLIGYLLMFYTLDLFGITMLDFFTDQFYIYSGMAGYELFLTGVLVVFRWIKLDIREMFPKAINPKPLLLLAICAAFELYTLTLLGLSYFLDQLSNENAYLFSVTNRSYLASLSLIVFILGILAFREYMKSAVDRAEQETGHSYGQHIQDLLTSMSSIRHDVINHLTVLEGLMKRDMADKALHYLQTLNREHAEVIEQVDGIVDPGVASLIASKAQTCQKYGIQLLTRLQTATQFHFMESVDLVRVVGNLMDNAISATQKRPPSERYIHITWTDGALSIENTGPELSSEFLSNMFALGFSTKGTSGGSGLAIVRKTIQKYGGEIEVISNQGVTRFTIRFHAASTAIAV